MVTTNDPDFPSKIKENALHGMSKDAWKRYSDDGFIHYQVIQPGFKYNMTDLQAAIGIHQLPRINSWLERRDEIWSLYNEAFADLPIIVQVPDEPGTIHAHHLYTLLIDKKRCGMTRDEFMDRLYGLNIGTGVHYIAVHLHQYYRNLFGCVSTDYPNATWLSERTVSIPLGQKLTVSDVDDVVNCIRFIFQS